MSPGGLIGGLGCRQPQQLRILRNGECTCGLGDWEYFGPWVPRCIRAPGMPVAQAPPHFQRQHASVASSSEELVTGYVASSRTRELRNSGNLAVPHPNWVRVTGKWQAKATDKPKACDSSRMVTHVITVAPEAPGVVESDRGGRTHGWPGRPHTEWQTPRAETVTRIPPVTRQVVACPRRAPHTSR